MRVRINGKEVEVGSSQDIRKKGDLREPLKQDKQFPKLRILGREIDMNNPDDVQWAIRSYRIQGMIFMLIGLIFIKYINCAIKILKNFKKVFNYICQT